MFLCPCGIHMPGLSLRGGDMMSKNFLEVLVFGVVAIAVAVMVLHVALPIQEKSRLMARYGDATDRSLFQQNPRS